MMSIMISSCKEAFCSDQKITNDDLEVYNALKISYANLYDIKIDSCIPSNLKLYTKDIDTTSLKEFAWKMNSYNRIFTRVHVYSYGNYQFKLYPIYDDFSKDNIKEIGVLPIGME